VGCQDIDGFEAVALGEKVDVEKVTPGMVAKAKEVLAKDPDLRCLMLECTELPPYSDALRKETKLPVYDAITCANMFMAGFHDNPRFGIQEWQDVWDGTQEEYVYGMNLSLRDSMKLVNERDEKAVEEAKENAS